MDASDATSLHSADPGLSGSFAAGLWRWFTNDRDTRHWLAAERAFLAADLETAQQQYRRVRNASALSGKARLMDDWIRFQRGDYSTGWPRYPGATFIAPAVPTEKLRTDSQPLHVADPRQPMELGAQGAMRQWDGREPLRKPLLVWFNFKHSLGGEILASRLVTLLRKRCHLPLVLACTARLGPLLRATFPDCQIVDKAADLRPVSETCDHYVLARDLLRLLVSSDADFALLAGERLMAPMIGGPRKRPAGDRPRIALSWKTTNGPQGRYRNIPLADLARVLAEHDVDWHVAQHGDVTADLGDLRRLAPGASIVAGTLHPLGDMASFANELLAMDAVVTVDNTLLHLAGGLRLPTLALISAPAYWAWPSAGTASRWYASVTLLRHATPGAWGDVVSALSQALRGQFSQGAAGVGQSSDVEAVADQTRSRTDRHPA